MDVDTADIEVSAAETSKGRPKIRCFFCDNEGHMKKDCRKFKHSKRREEVHSHRKLRPEWPQSKKPKRRKRSHLLTIQTHLWSTLTT